MEPWYKIATPPAEVRDGRSFNPDEFAVALERVAAWRGPDFHALSRLYPKDSDEKRLLDAMLLAVPR
jgi:hypothetical protein